jgi:aconitate hydratase
MDSFSTRRTGTFGGRAASYYSLEALVEQGHSVERLPFTLRVLLENVLRNEDGQRVRRQDAEAVLAWRAEAEPEKEIAYSPARVLLQDFTGVPCVVDLASMRDAMASLGGDPARINPLQPAELVIDHSIQVDSYGRPDALDLNLALEFERNEERYAFLKWGQAAFDNFAVVPPNTGICHQVNLERLARVVFMDETAEGLVGYPDTLVGTDSHTTMVNGLGVLGWGVGGIEAEAAMLGQPVSMLLPQVVGFRLTGRLREGTTATDLVLTVTEMLRKHGVVGKFVEFYGPGASSMTLADRATIANMAPEYGATCGFFPVDEETLRYLVTSGREPGHVRFVEEYAKANMLWWDASAPEPEYSSRLELDLATVEPSVAGPKRPQDRVPLGMVRKSFADAFPAKAGVAVADPAQELADGSIVIAAITSCTNTSNPSVMVAAGLVAKKARERGLRPKPWVKTSLAPGSRVVTEYLRRSGLLEELEAIGFGVVGYGCTTCIGNSGPLPDEVLEAVRSRDLAVASVLSGNRNFEGRVNSEVKANYLMSPPLVVAYALAGSIEVDIAAEPLGKGSDGRDVYLRDVWPSSDEVAEVVRAHVDRSMFLETYASLFRGDDRWRGIPVEPSERYAWQPDSTYVRRAPYFDGMAAEAPAEVAPLEGLRVLALLGDSVTTDHISPAGSIKPNSPAGEYLEAQGVAPKDFNSYGSRRGNHEVMARGTFANVRLRNRLAPGTEGGFTVDPLSGEVTTIFAASETAHAHSIPLMVIAGKEYGTGSSRDWAAKGPLLLGVRVVLAESFERIHRSNLVGMGILPLQFMPGDSADSLGLDGSEAFDVVDFPSKFSTLLAEPTVLVRASRNGTVVEFPTRVRIDTPSELEYYRNQGVLQFVLRRLLRA